MKIKQNQLNFLTFVLTAAGTFAVFSAVWSFPVAELSAASVSFSLVTIFLSSYLRVHLPRTNNYLTASDTMVFLAFLLYGWQIAVLIAACETLFTMLNMRFKGNKTGIQTAIWNASGAVLATLITTLTVTAFFGTADEVKLQPTSIFVLMLTTMAVTQFLMNSVFVCILMSYRTGKTLRRIFWEHCFNVMVMFAAGAAFAGLCFEALKQINMILFTVAFAFAALLFFTYRRYVNDVRETADKAEQSERNRAEQAEQHIVELQHHITEQERIGNALRESKERFRHAAFHDGLTDLPNRNLFIETLEFMLQKSKRDGRGNFAVLFMDLNRFKTINDSLGHSIGDRLILHVAKRLSGLMGDGDLVARFGGDEFGVILSGIDNIDDASQFALLIKHKIAAPFTIAGRQVFTNVSIGIALYNENYTEGEDILRDADIAMYHAKESNADYVVFDQTMHTRAVTLLQLETDLRHAVERDELLVYYQPIIDLATMSLMGFEALMRWQHPQRGLVPPGEFIPVSEETGLIIPLTLWIFRKACSQLVEWQERSPLNKSLMMSINLSSVHFTQPDLVDNIKQILSETKINPHCVKLELTESAVMENAETTILMLKQLRTLGVQLSIDDFGTGYSSLSYLHRFPIDMLKIDRSFVSTMEGGSENGEIVRTIIALAKTLGLSVVAEGIESIHQLHQLRILGCEYGQGFLFSRPVPVAEIEKILEDKNRWQNIIPDNNPATLALNREYTHLRLAK